MPTSRHTPVHWDDRFATMCRMPFTLLYVLLAVVVVVFVAGAVALAILKPELLRKIFASRGREAKQAEPVPYRARQFLTKTEASFYHTLRQAVGDRAHSVGSAVRTDRSSSASPTGDRYTIAIKVRLADVLKCDAKEHWQRHQNRINSKHLDFVLCEPNTMSILVGIELDDRSHSRSRRQQGDAFLGAAMNAANLPLLRFPAQAHYDANAIAQQIDGVLGPARPRAPPARTAVHQT